MGLKILPSLIRGEGVIEGEILKIKVSKGEEISTDQVLLEVMTDKASMEVPSSISGKFTLSILPKEILSLWGQVFLLWKQKRILLNPLKKTGRA